MKRTQYILLITFWAIMVLNLLLVILFELFFKSKHQAGTSESIEFVLLSVMELVTICAIPLTLRLFKFGVVHRQLVQQKEKSLLMFGLIRLGVFAVLLTLNTLFYCIYNNDAFGYMSIILFLSMMFVYPSMDRCYDETDYHA